MLTLLLHPTSVAVGISVPAGSVRFTGFVPSLQQLVLISTGAGRLTLTGYAPSLALGGDVIAGPGLGHLVITGFPPTASLVYLLAPIERQVSITQVAGRSVTVTI